MSLFRLDQKGFLELLFIDLFLSSLRQWQDCCMHEDSCLNYSASILICTSGMIGS